MRAWLDRSEGEPVIYVDRSDGPVVAVLQSDTRRGGGVPPSAVELVTVPSVVAMIRADLRRLRHIPPFVRGAFDELLNQYDPPAGKE